jgi:hypothetical protein
MFIFLTIVMGPGFGFMLYALFQFWREEWRMRHENSARPGRVVTFVTADNPLDGHTPDRASGEPVASAASENESAVERAKVVTTYLNNRVAVIPSQAGRLAVNRAAKG